MIINLKWVIGRVCVIFSSNVQLLSYRQKGKWIFKFNMNWGCVMYVEQREKQAKNFSEYGARLQNGYL